MSSLIVITSHTAQHWLAGDVTSLGQACNACSCLFAQLVKLFFRACTWHKEMLKASCLAENSQIKPQTSECVQLFQADFGQTLGSKHISETMISASHIKNDETVQMAVDRTVYCSWCWRWGQFRPQLVAPWWCCLLLAATACNWRFRLWQLCFSSAHIWPTWHMYLVNSYLVHTHVAVMVISPACTCQEYLCHITTAWQVCSIVKHCQGRLPDSLILMVSTLVSGPCKGNFSTTSYWGAQVRKSFPLRLWLKL